MANYQVDIDMETATVETLRNQGFQLYGFKAVRAPLGGGAPVVWFKSDTYSTNTDVNWETRFEAYTSNSAIIPNGRIEASNHVAIDLEQTFKVTGSAGTGTVVGEGTRAAISILNETAAPFTCGISQVQNGTASPLCAFPLYGHHLDVIAPIEKVLLLFSTRPVNTGTVIEQSYGPSIFVDLTGAPENRRQVSYDINRGWSWDGGVWARQIRPSESLVPLLIENQASAVGDLVAAA